MGHGNYSHAAHAALMQPTAAACPSRYRVPATGLPRLDNPKGLKVRGSATVPITQTHGHCLCAGRHRIDGRHPQNLLARQELPTFVLNAAATLPTHSCCSWPWAMPPPTMPAADRAVWIHRRTHGPVAHLVVPGGGGGVSSSGSYDWPSRLAQHADLDCWVEAQKGLPLRDRR